MAWQSEVGSGVNRAVDYRDLVTKWVAMATSQHVATVVINNGGTGGTYIIGDVVTLTHGGAHLDAKFEVLTVSGSQIATMKIVSSGAFSNRIAAAPSINVAGTGYVTNEVVEVQGGTSREKGKIQVTTQSGGVPSAIASFETGGAYSVAPGLTGAAVLSVGPSTKAGNDDLTVDITMTGLVGTTGLAVTGGGGSGATVDITLAESGWVVDGRNTNDALVTVDFEKTVVLKGDAAGKTNKPYIGFRSWSAVSGLDTRYGVAVFGMGAHNAATGIHLQPNISPAFNPSTGGMAVGVHLLCDENIAQEMDFWITIDDHRLGGVVNINPGAANTDDGEYMQWHAGLMDIYGTESEQPYSMLVAGSCDTISVNPSVAASRITGIAECMAATAADAPVWFYHVEDAVWHSITNAIELVAGTKVYTMYPMGFPLDVSSASDPNNIVAEGLWDTFRDYSLLTRGAPGSKLYPIFSETVDEPFLFPLNALQKNSTPISTDGPKGQVRGFYWLSATDAAGAQILNMSEDFVTIGSDRYRVFHNHVHHSRYQYIAIKEDV